MLLSLQSAYYTLKLLVKLERMEAGNFSTHLASYGVPIKVVFPTYLVQTTPNSYLISLL